MLSLSRRAFFIAVSAGSASALAQFKRAEGVAAEREKDATFRVDVNVVNVLATVRDGDGRIVGNLSQKDFVVLDEGKPAEIRYFAQQSDLPLSLGLLVDTSMSQLAVLEEERAASKQFLNQVLRPEQDQAFLIKFDVEVELLQDFTASKDKLEKALSGLKTPERTLRRRFQAAPAANPFQSANFQIAGLPRGRRRPSQGRRPGGGNPASAGIGTTLYDAVYLASNELLREQPGRKAIVLLSDGVDFGSKVTEKTAIEAALRSDTLIYSILYSDEGRRGTLFGGQGKDGENALGKLAAATGGGMFEVSGKLNLSGIYTRIQEELRNQYSIGFAPAMSSGPAFRELEIRTTNKNLKVQSRTGYYPKPA